MRRLVLTAAFCFSMGCVKGVCYDYRDCPAPQICNANGACVLQNASTTLPPLAMPDAGPDADAGDGEETGGSDDVAADTTPECPPFVAAVGDSCAERDAL